MLWAVELNQLRLTYELFPMFIPKHWPCILMHVTIYPHDYGHVSDVQYVAIYQHGHWLCIHVRGAVDACAEYGSAQWASAQSSVMHYGSVSRITIQGLYSP